MDPVGVLCPACRSMDGPTAVTVFWWLTAAACILWAYLAHRASKPMIVLPHDVDPYVVATLRKGPELAMQAGLAGLVDRGLVESVDGQYHRVEGAVPGRDLTYVESSLWSALATAQTLPDLMFSPVTQSVRDDVQRRADSSPYVVSGWRATRWKLGALLLVPLLFALYRILGGLTLQLPIKHMVFSAILVGSMGLFWALVLRAKQSRLDPRVSLAVHDATVRHNLMKNPAESTMPGVVGLAGWPVALTIMAVASSQNMHSFYPEEMAEKMGPLLAAGPASSTSTPGAFASCGSSGSSCGSSSDGGGSSCGGGGCGGGGCGSS